MEYKIVYTSDPGHGWGKVLRSTINELGIADQISPYSHQELGFVYLEEDCDLPVFITALKARGDTVNTVERYVRRTHIRNLPNYTNEELVEV